MARLVADSPSAIALGETASFSVDAGDIVGGLANLELWERTIPFPPGGTPAPTPVPPFTLRTSPVSESSTNPTDQPVPYGSIYQVRLFPRGRGSPELAENPRPRSTLGALDFPSITRIQDNVLTSCGNRPRVMVTPGGTFVSFAFATQAPTMARVQLLDRPPQVTGPGAGAEHPFFFEPAVIASAVSTKPAIVHRLSPVDQISPDAAGHIPLHTNQELWFAIVAWNHEGNYDVVWNTTGLVPATPPEMIKTKQRIVRARMTKLYCHNDSDELGDGTGEFTFGMSGGSATDTAPPVSWTPMQTGSRLKIPDNTTCTISPPNAADMVSLWVDGEEDDSGSIPPDLGEMATATGSLGNGPGNPGTTLEFPVGHGKEVVTAQVMTLTSVPTGLGGDELSFSADIVYSINYI